MRIRIVGATVVVLFGVSSAVLIGRSPAMEPAGQERMPVTFSKDVAPILYKNCVECHRPTMFAPMSLMTFEEARPWARSIKQRIVAREMPPWGADPAIGHFKNDPRLSQAEIDTIAAWVDTGAPKGNDKDLPKRPTFVDGWTIGKPDAVLTMTEAYKIPATGTIPYQYIKIPTSFTEDKWLQAIEIKPGARAHVHHVIAYTQPAGTEMRSESPLGRTNIGGTTPNKPGVTFPDGVARLLRANSEIVLQVHYTTNGEAAADQTTVGMIFAKEPPKKIVRGGMALNPRFLIPAGAPNHEVVATANINEDMVLTTMTPHMHTRGKDMTYIAIYPDGREETLLSVPKYDFEWQITYQLAEPKLLPKGSKLRVVAHFDNSTNNKFNPDPTKDVRWGDQTWEEMMIGFYGTIAEIEPVTTMKQKQ